MASLGSLFQPQRQKTIEELVSDFLGLEPVQHRAAMLPMVKDMEGNPAFGYPQFVVDAVEAIALPGHVMKGGSYTPQDVTEMAIDMGMIAAPVGYATAPKGAIAMGGSNPTKYYHGTKNKFKNFDVNLSRDGDLGKGIYFADNLDTAKIYGDNIFSTNIDDNIIFPLEKGNTVADSIKIADFFKDIYKKRGVKVPDRFNTYAKHGARTDMYKQAQKDLGYDFLKDEGYGAISYILDSTGGTGRQISVFNPSVLKDIK